VLTCGDVLRNPDDRADRGADGPNASFGCRKAAGRGVQGREEQRSQYGQDRQHEQPQTCTERLPATGHDITPLSLGQLGANVVVV